MASHKKSHITDALVDDLQSAFAKHKFSGTMILKNAETESGGNPCGEGQTPHEISIQLPNGTWVSKIICV